MISGDKNALSEGSEAYTRLGLQRASVEKLDVFVWPQIHLWHEISETAHENSYDVITAQDPFWRGLLAWRIARRTGAKLNLQVHADISKQSFTKRTISKFLLRRADSIRVVSDAIRKQVEMLGVKGKISVLPIYVDIESFRKIAPKTHDHKVILWIGRFEEEKDPANAIYVLKEVLKNGIDARLIMLGSGSLDKSLKQLSEKLPVEFPGWTDPKPYLQIADVVLCTSRQESWGASIIQALAAGVPVVAPDIGIAREAGAIVAGRENLAEAVCSVLRSGTQGKLLMSLPNKEAWAKLWRETLV